MQNSVSHYLDKIGRYPLLDKNHEIDLARTIETGVQAEDYFFKSTGIEYEQTISADDLAEKTMFNPESRDNSIPSVLGQVAFLQVGNLIDEVGEKVEAKKVAKETFINSNLRLVVMVAKRYRNTERLELLDLIQEGNLGLEHAVDKFDYTRGYKFSTYAMWWIRQAIGRAIDDKSTTIRIPRHRRNDLRRANIEASESSMVKLSKEHSRLNTLLTVDSLDATNDDTNQSLMSSLADENSNGAFKNVEHRSITEEFIEQLPDERSREIFRHKFGLDGYCEMTVPELAEKYGVKTQRIYQIIKRNIDSFRDIRNFEAIDIY